MQELAMVVPPRSVVKEAFRVHGTRLIDRAAQVQMLLRQQKERTRSRGRKSLDGAVCDQRIKVLKKAAADCFAIADQVCAVTAEFEWVLPVVPRMPGADLLGGQPLDFLGKLGKFHRLYLGKHAYHYHAFGGRYY